MTNITTLSSTHPETGPGNPGTLVARTASAISGVVVFNQPPVSTEDPRVVIEGAIASGDTTARRVKLLQEAVLTPPSSEFQQK